MEYSIRGDETTKELYLQGRLTFSDNVVFRKIVDDLKEYGGSKCVFDLSGLEFIDSAGLGMLMLLRDATVGRPFTISIRKADGQVRRMLEIAKFDALIPFED
ncbi:STAS domain-containing protein [Terasakiella pusilla]|jgi:stage II sporulation protein AA (anti-sigma F factor antagonist)|uniref:STAS domain-containing protein n=1 Tax=Terasakiella pusilla TaxID=64973 RepID=UPI003AA8938E